MVKPIITAQEVRQARKEGRTEIAVPSGALVTAQARDDAGAFGIRLVAQASLSAAPVCAVPGRITLYAGKPFME